MSSDILGRMIGRWDLRGRMGAVPLHQAVDARWSMGGGWVEMECREVEGAPYEARYFIGWHEETDAFVLAVFDSTGVYPEPSNIVGRGRRDENGVVFEFGTPVSFVNRFSFHSETDIWTHELSSVAADGTQHPFATKQLTRLTE